MDEIQRLQDELQAATTATASLRISERNVVELVSKLREVRCFFFFFSLRWGLGFAPVPLPNF